MKKYWQQGLLDDEDVEQFKQEFSKVMKKKYGKRKQQNKRCKHTVDFVEEQTGDGYRKTKVIRKPKGVINAIKKFK